MVRCTHPTCGWQSIAASAAGGREQLAEHLVAAHAREVDAEADIPEGMVQVRVDGDDEWRTLSVEQARALQRAVHGDD